MGTAGPAGSFRAEREMASVGGVSGSPRRHLNPPRRAAHQQPPPPATIAARLHSMSSFNADVIFSDEASSSLRLYLASAAPGLLPKLPAADDAGAASKGAKKAQGGKGGKGSKGAKKAQGGKGAKGSKGAKGAKGGDKEKGPSGGGGGGEKKSGGGAAKSDGPIAEPSVAQFFADKSPEAYDRYTLRESAAIDYGVAPPAGVPGAGKYYVTTAINYTNGYPHMGHAYEGLSADVIGRYHRMYGRDTYYLTGTDEHGQKIAKTAEREGVSPIDICDKYATAFQALNQRLRVSNDGYVRTTQPHHMEVCQRLWQRVAATSNEAGESDIYLNTYKGWYNEREEMFVSDSDAQLCDYKDASSGKPLVQMEEESYFFRMSRYQARLVEHISSNAGFVQPEERRQQVLKLLEEPLRDLCISRTTFDWGIPCPAGSAPNHVMYVWFDALTNYLSQCVAPGGPLEGEGRWPAECHVIGKDILWFHSVIWPCMLMSAGLPLPARIFAHGFISGSDGRKMSKSLGNVVDPHDVLDYCDPDTFRWYLCTESAFGGDLRFSVASLILKHNSELCDTLGNLVHRCTNLAKAHCGSAIPAASYGAAAGLPLPLDAAQIVAEADAAMVGACDFNHVAGAAMALLRALNLWITEQAPWKLKGGGGEETKKQAIIRAVVEGVWFAAHLLAPFIPCAAQRIFDRIRAPPRPLASFRDLGAFENVLPEGTEVLAGDILFGKLRDCVADPPEAEGADGKKKKKGGGAKGDYEAKKKAREAAAQPEATYLDIRVGKIVEAWAAEDSEHLFVERIDVGEDEPRLICSGLREFYALEDLRDRRVLVFCNLKPRKMGGNKSQGMVLCGEKEVDGARRVEFVEPPPAAAVGERVAFGDLAGEPQSANFVQKKKVLEKVFPDLRGGADGVAAWKGNAMTTSAGPCTLPTLRDCELH